jgi:hypothetical protein
MHVTKLCKYIVGKRKESNMKIGYEKWRKVERNSERRRRKTKEGERKYVRTKN